MKRFTAILLLVALALCSCGGKEGTVSVTGGGEEVAALNLALSALIDGDADKYLSAFPPQVAEDYEKLDVYMYFFSLADMSAWLKSSLVSYEDAYGKGISINGSLSAIIETEVAALGDANLDYYTYMRYVTAENTEKVISAVFNYTIEGDSGNEQKAAKLYFVKQDGKWYLHPCFALYSF